MRHGAVRNVALLVFGGSLVAATTFAWLRSHGVAEEQPVPAVPASSAAAAFARDCAECHSLAEVVQYLANAPAARREPQALRDFLREHFGAADAASQTEFLLRVIAERGAAPGTPSKTLP